jgi:carbon storage regulator CsrA
MLILTRRLGEILILELPTGEEIQIAVLELKGSEARLGIDAPPEVNIIREELLFDDELAE